MSGPEIVAVTAGVGGVLTAVALVFERLTGFFAARRAARAAQAHDSAAISQAALTLALSLDIAITPLRAEMAELRAEIHALRATLAEHGITPPQGPFRPPAPPQF